MMITTDKIKNTLFFDIETTTRYKTYEEYKEHEPECAQDFENQIRKKRECDSLTTEEAYKEYGMLSPEHGQVVTIACRIWNEEEGQWNDEIFGFKDWEDYESRDKKRADKDILIKFNEVLYGIFGDKIGSLGGYRINKFDIPYLYRRMLMTGLYPQQTLITVGVKSWDIKNLELYDWWTGTGANGYSGFSSACELMGIGSSKEEGMDGRQVCFRFWDDHNIQGINQYCMRDVVKSAEFAIALSEPKMKKRHQVTMQEWLEEQTKKNEEVEVELE